MTLLRLSVVFTALSALVSMHLASAHEAAQHVKPVSPTAQRLPLGDGKISTTPRQGYVERLAEASFPGGGGAHRMGEWIDKAAGTWDSSGKPQVEVG